MEQLRPQGVIATHQRLATRSVSCVPSGRRERSELAVCVNCPHVSALFPCLVPAFLAKSPTGAPQYTPVFAGVPRRRRFCPCWGALTRGGVEVFTRLVSAFRHLNRFLRRKQSAN